ncbi:hypothetical protein D3C79_686660 [compost metagenome]
MVVTPRVGFFQFGHSLQPGGDLHWLLQSWQQRLQIPLEGHMRLTQFAHFRRVDIHVDYLGVRRKGVQLAGHAIVKTRAHGYQ